MPTFREFLRVAEMTVTDKTSGKRMREIYDIMKKHGAFGGVTPEKAVDILEDLGPTYVKMGQIASNRSDILPREYCEAFERLRANVPPLSFETVIESIERSLKKSWHEIFDSIEEAPLGSASIAQVHKATLADGSVVAIKVRRPGIAQTMAEDITLMKHLLAVAEFSVSAEHEGLLLSFGGLVTELERTTAEELDFTVELGNLVRFYHDMQEQSGVTSPLPYPDLSTEEVLVMEFATGTLINNKEGLAKQQVSLDQIGNRLAQSYVTQVIDNGFFHADPHPGNILVCDNTIVWIDLGMTGSLTKGEQALVGKVFRGVATRDEFALKEALLALSKATGPVDHSLLLNQMNSLLASYASVDLADINIGNAFLDVIEILRSQNLTLPPSFTMLARGFLTLEGVLAEIAPQTSIIDVVSQHVEKQLKNPTVLEAKAKELFVSSVHSAEATTRLPSQVSNTLDMLNHGELSISTDMKMPQNLLSSIYTISGRLALAMISAGLFIGSSVLCTTALQPQILGVPLLGFLGYLGAFVLGVYVIWHTLASRHNQRNNKRID